jgi:hypothetical protein
VTRCLLITQHTSVLEREPWFVPQVHPYGRTVLKSRLKWSMAWWKRAKFYHRRSVDHWILAGGIDHFLIAYSSGFIVRISVRANPDDRVVNDEVPISGPVGPSIGSVIAGCLTAVWNVVDEFLSRVLKIVVVHHSSYCWAGCSRLSSCAALLIQIVVVCCSEWQRSEQELHARRELLIVDPRCHEFTRMNLSASPLKGASLSTSGRQIFGVGSKEMQVSDINLMWTEGTRFLDWFGPSHGVIVLRPILMYYAIEIGSSLFLSGSFWVVSEIFRMFSPSFPYLSSMWIYHLYL